MFTLLLLGLNAPTLPFSLFITYVSNTSYLPLPFLYLSSLCVASKGFTYNIEGVKPVITTEWSSLKEQHHEMFYFRVFYESYSHRPLIILLDPFQNFKTYEDVLSSRCTSGIKDNGGNMATGVIDTCG